MSMFKNKIFRNKSFYRNLPPAGIPNIVADIWQTFEFNTPGGGGWPAALSASDHNGGQSWSIIDPFGWFSTNTSGSMHTISTVNGTVDAGTRGLMLNQTGALTQAIVACTFNPTPGPSISYGFWYYFPQQLVQCTQGLAELYNVGGIGAAVSFGATSHSFTIYNGTGVIVAPNNWYWLTSVFNSGKSSNILNVYNSNGIFVGTDSGATLSNLASVLIIGDTNGGQFSGAQFFDNFVVDYTTAKFPLGP